MEADFALKRRDASFRSQLASSPQPEGHDRNECKRILAYPVDEAKRLGSPVITAAHLILGALREHDSIAARFLLGDGLDLRSARQLLRLR